jgi:hypothetical protein
MLAAVSASAAEWTFEDAEAGKLPKGWTAAKTGEGPGSQWQVIADKTAPAGPKVLAQVSVEGPKPLFNLCVADAPKLADVDLTVQFKAVRGKIDQGGGPVWRYQDKDNYYVARMNPLELNYRVYKVVGGKRTQLGTADVDADDPAEVAKKWHTIRIVHRGDRIQCYLNGKLDLDVKDDAIKAAGTVGLWTKADAVTSFDKLAVEKPQ